MKVSLILAHPDPGSFNHAIAKRARETLERNGHDVVFHDLYLEGFDPVLPWEEIPKAHRLALAAQHHPQEENVAFSVWGSKLLLAGKSARRSHLEHL